MTTAELLAPVPQAFLPSARDSPESGHDILGFVQEIPAPNMESLEDTEILERIGNGDRQAFRVFYQRHSGRTLHALRQMCGGDRPLAEDLLQDVFLLVWRKAASYRAERGEPMGWLFTITRNRAFDHYRRTGGRQDLDDQELSTWPAPADVHRDTRLSLQQAMSHLSSDQQRALQMTYYGGYTYEEAADRLQVPLGTLKSRIKTGLRRLRSAFESSLCLFL